MPNVDELIDQIKRLAPDEQRRVLFALIRDSEEDRFGSPWLPSGIEKQPGVCGGVARIAKTRIPIWVLEQMRRLGCTEAEILRCYPLLSAEDLVHAWTYVDLHETLIHEQIAQNEEA